MRGVDPTGLLLLSEGQRLVVCCARRIAHGARPCAPAGAAGDGRDDGSLLGAAIAPLFAIAGPGCRAFRAGPPNSLGLSRDEHRLLRALAAAQRDDAAGVDGVLWRLALDRRARARLAAAIAEAAALLIVLGHTLPEPRPARLPIPPSARACIALALGA